MRKLTFEIMMLLAFSAGAADEMSIDRLLQIVASKNLRTVESVIAELPLKMKDSDYVLMYRSRSLQEATFAAPRAILYSESGRFVVTFNGGDPNLSGHDTLETIQYRDDSRTFEFREISFADGKKPAVSVLNPQKCLACHQSRHRQDIDPRPNWEPYFIWPGAYGSFDGFFPQFDLKKFLGILLRLPDDENMINSQMVPRKQIRVTASLFRSATLWGRSRKTSHENSPI